MNRKIAVVVALLALVVLVAYVFLDKQSVQEETAVVPETENKEYRTLLLDDVEVRVEVVRTVADKRQGLSGRADLPEGTGMLFIFDEPSELAFWMKDMHFAIDMVWFDASWSVVSVSENATPHSYPQHFSPETPAQYVLEVPAFFARENGIATGTQATLQ